MRAIPNAFGLAGAIVVAAVVVPAGAARAQAPEIVELPSADGVTIHGELYRSAPAEVPVVLLFHQGRGSAVEYERIAPRLAAAGYHALAVDLRRGGDMFGRDNLTAAGVGGGADVSYCDVYPDLEATLAYARSTGLPGPVVAWGSSYSAALVIRLGVEHADEVAAVLAFSTASGEPMAGCEPEPWVRRLQRPLLALRPEREMAIDWIREQHRLFAEAGAETFVAADSRHGSSMLDAERNPGDTGPSWARVDAFMRQHAPTPGREVHLESDGWELVGNLRTPLTAGPHPMALLLHNAAGSRADLLPLASALADRGVASLRLDLRGHGDSVNRGRFDPDDPASRHLPGEGDRDVAAALRALPGLADIAPGRIAILGASYTGEEMVQAGRDLAIAAYVGLSPGSLSDESIDWVDRSGARWLFLRAERERPFFDDLFADIEARTDAEVHVIPGVDARAGHGTRMLADPSVLEMVADWIAAALR